MSAETTPGAEGGQSFLGTLNDLAIGGLGVYGQVRVAEIQREQEQQTAQLGASIAQASVARSDSRYKWIALAGVGLVISLIVIKKGNLAAS